MHGNTCNIQAILVVISRIRTWVLFLLLSAASLSPPLLTVIIIFFLLPGLSIISMHVLAINKPRRLDRYGRHVAVVSVVAAVFARPHHRPRLFAVVPPREGGSRAQRVGLSASRRSRLSASFGAVPIVVLLLTRGSVASVGAAQDVSLDEWHDGCGTDGDDAEGGFDGGGDGDGDNCIPEFYPVGLNDSVFFFFFFERWSI